MTIPQPLSVAQVLQMQVNDFQRKITKVGEYNRFEFVRLMKDLDHLQGAGGDVVAASVMKARVYSSTGQFGEVEKVLRNAELNKGHSRARAARISHLVNHGFASQALALMDDLFAHREGFNFVKIAEMAFGAGVFIKTVEKLDESIKNSEVLAMTDVADIARRCAAVMEALGVTDAQVAAMLDAAGEILRANKLYWQGELSDVTAILPGSGAPALLYDYRVFVSPQEAARLGWQLTEALVTRDLAIQGVHIGFVGTDLPALRAA